MHAFYDEKDGIGQPRPHPWQASLRDPNAKFVDFLAHPELVRTRLEDFLPYTHQTAVQRFFSLVEWMNSPVAIWETTESYFWPLATHKNQFFSNYSVVCSGRLVFFCRDHLQQCLHADWIFDNLLRTLQAREPTVPNACVGVFTVPTLFLSLSNDGGRTAPECKAIGVRCYGFGRNEDEAFEGFGHGVDAVRDVTNAMIAFMPAMPAAR